MLRDNLVGLIEPMFNSTAREFSMPRSRKRGMLQVDRVGDRRSKAVLARNFLSKTGDRKKKKWRRFAVSH
jgi:hypothetical protein